jgi:glycosyltransferase involved in cell wall biosynthesis
MTLKGRIPHVLRGHGPDMASIAMVVTNACSPDPRVLRHAAWLAHEGHDITVHAYDRQEQYPMSESHKGVRIMRYHLGKSPYGGMLKTAFGIRKFNQNVSRGLATNRPQVIYCHDADTLVIGCHLKKKYNIPLVFDMHDLQHTWIRMPSSNSLIRKILSWWMEKQMLRRLKHVDLILTTSGKISDESTSPGFREYLQAHGQEARVIENRPESDELVQKSTRDGWCVGYLGRVREVESFQLLLEAVLLMEPKQRPRIRIAGDGVAFDSVSQLLNTAKINHDLQVEITGSFDTEEFPKIIQEVDVMYAMYSPSRGNILQGAIPVKMFDAAAHGVPSVVNSGCLMGEIAEHEEIGQSVEWMNSAQLSESLFNLREVKVQLNTTSERERKRFLEALNTLIK